MITSDDLPAMTDHINALFFGGISLVAEPGADAYAQLCGQADDRLIMIDPNIRPAFITDEQRYRRRLNTMLTRADIVKMSDEDMEWLGTSPEALSAQGTALILITRGAEGVDAYFGSEGLSVPARTVPVVDTVGAGDTFNAGVLAGLSRAGLLSRNALRQANSLD
ncbi:unnamed protein product, partial [Cyprideis torosa]